MRCSKSVLIVIMALTLPACDTLPVVGKVRIPAELLQQCQPLVKLEGNTGADMLRNIVANAEIHYECKDIHSKLIQAVSDNKPDKK